MNLPKQLIKQLPKQQLINGIKAIPDSIVTVTFIEKDTNTKSNIG